MEAMLNFIPAPIAIALMLLGFVALAVGGIRLGYKATVKDLALELVEKAELSIMGSGQGDQKEEAGVRCSPRQVPGGYPFGAITRRGAGRSHRTRLLML